MVSKNELKLLTSLSQKKYRQSEGLFVVEGIKSVNEFIHSKFEIHKIYTTSDKAFSFLEAAKISIVTPEELKKISQLVTPNEVLGVFKIPENKNPKMTGLLVALDKIQDPGNLGTIIRLCDWFNITDLVCSTDTVDCFNPKVVQASMGSLSRVNVFYTDLQAFLNLSPLPVFLTLLDGKNVYQSALPENGILVMGNEANGISQNIIQENFNAISIPRFGETAQTESLNVATATAILLSEFRRRP